jgi:hypothetical protein
VVMKLFAPMETTGRYKPFDAKSCFVWGVSRSDNRWITVATLRH